MMTTLFWNVNRRSLGHFVAMLARDRDCDLVVLAENRQPAIDILADLNRATVERPYYLISDPAGRVTLFARLGPQRVQPLANIGGLSMWAIDEPILGELLLGFVHLPSKLFLSAEDQLQLSMQWARFVEDVELERGHQRTMILGDFNMNPFEPGMVGSSGFHAVSDRRVAARGKRTVASVERPFFYNPMWNFFGARLPGPPGTYFYSSTGPLSYYWNIFDQVILRPSLLHNIRDGDVNIISLVGEQSLLGVEGRPDREVGSDHLPIVVTARVAVQEVA